MTGPGWRVDGAPRAGAASDPPPERIDEQRQAMQRLRLRRALMGSATYVATLLLAFCVHLLGLLEFQRLLHYAIAVLVLNLLFLGAILSGFNLRLRDPGMTIAQIVVSALPALYVMYFVQAPQARVGFLMLGLATLLFAVFRFGLRGALYLSLFLVGSYGLLLGALARWAPERIDVPAEVPVVLAYALALVLISFLGGYIRNLRRTVQQRNADLQQAMERLRLLAMEDPLTGLPNRRTILGVLAHEAERHAGGAGILCVCMIDVDLFKEINDRFGHQVGDAVLTRLAETLAQLTRDGDRVGRVGGEEFLLVLPNTTLEGALLAAERVREVVAAMSHDELPDGERMTLSIGVAVHRPGEPVDTTVSRADSAMYLAKTSGRNRVQLATG